MAWNNWLPWGSTVNEKPRGFRTFTPEEKPLGDFDGSEQYARFGTFASKDRPFPYPYLIGCVSGFMPMQDGFLLMTAYGKNAFGPNTGGTPVPMPLEQQYPQLRKVTA